MAIEELVDEWGESPRSINNGECMEFVNQLFLEYEFESLERIETDDLPSGYVDHERGVKSEPYHMWVTDGDLHYDPEVPEGVRDWKDLPFFERTLGL